MEFVGLLSGGKDSVYTLHHALVQGHTPVALASLVPPEGKDELDSFMYQTVASSGLDTLARAIGLPLYTETITGTARNQRSEYGSRSAPNSSEPDEHGDETEHLVALLTKVKAAHPSVRAVAAGAILSNYQRVRVEHVCARLGLTPLAPLWERDQKALLDEMVQAGIHSVLVKVAGAGLGVNHLGKSLAQMQPTLLKLNALYDTHPCGEGGEYETFTLDAPLFLRPVLLEKVTTVISNPDPHATVAHLHLDALALGALKPAYAGDAESGPRRWDRARALCTEAVRVPRVRGRAMRAWERVGSKAYAREVAGAESRDGDEQEGAASVVAEVKREEEEPRASVRKTDDGWLFLAEVVAPPEKRGGEIEDEVHGCFAALTALLEAQGTSLLSLAHLTVYLSPSATTMALFPRINAVYAAHFGTSPPTRACVAVSGPGPGREGSWRIKLEGVARVGVGAGGTDEGEERRALHVQSMSYWAPANIGPYSQAILTANRLYIAGQIPLLPASLALPAPSSSSSSTAPAPAAQFAFDAALALQHVTRVARASLGGQRGRAGAEGAIAWVGPCAGAGSHAWRARVAACAAVWRAANGAAAAGDDGDDDDDEEDEDEDDEAQVDDDAVPPFLAVEAAALPKGADVEWQVTYRGGAAGYAPEDNDSSSDDEAAAAALQQDADECVRMETVSNTTARHITYHRSRPTPSPSSRSASAFAVLACSLDETRPHPLPGLARTQLAHVRAFYRPLQATVSSVRALARRVLGVPFASGDGDGVGSAAGPAVSFVPAQRLAVLGRSGDVQDAEVVFVLVGETEPAGGAGGP
ncbi:hypothetical protein JCM3770_007438 [Rhodotorula araucariae]